MQKAMKWLATAAFVMTMMASVGVRGEWTVQNPGIGTVFLSLDFETENVGWSAGFSNGIGNAYLKTVDGGNTMMNVLDDPLVTFMFLGTSAHSNDSATGCGFGLFITGAGAYTTDGGASWEQSYETDGKLLRGGCQSTTTSPSCYYMVGSFQSGPDYYNGVARSCDGGAHYDVFDWGIDMSTRYGSFLNDTYGFVAGGNFPSSTAKARVDLAEGSPNKHFMTDSIAVPMAKGRRFANRRAKDVADYQATIGRTYDGGKTWEEVFRSEGEFYFNQIDFVNDQVGVVVGENNRDGNGVILKTTDGGDTWRQVFHTDKSLLAVHMSDEREGWAGGAVFAVGLETYLLHTVDGGETWEEYETDLRHYIGQISGSDADHVWAMAFNQATSSLLQWVPE